VSGLTYLVNEERLEKTFSARAKILKDFFSERSERKHCEDSLLPNLPVWEAAQ
jgi:hypothetical protein